MAANFHSFSMTDASASALNYQPLVRFTYVLEKIIPVLIFRVAY